MSRSDLRVDINVMGTLNKNYWPAELAQDNVRGSPRQADNVECQACVIGYLYLSLCANGGAAAGVYTPGNGQEIPSAATVRASKTGNVPGRENPVPDHL